MKKSRLLLTLLGAGAITFGLGDPSHLPSSPVRTLPPLPKLTFYELRKTPDSFIRQLVPYAKEVNISSCIPTSVILAQACLETGFGKYVPGNNMFGIKGGKKKMIVKIGNRFVRRTSKYRPYSSINDSFSDYVKLIFEDERYQSARGISNPKKYIYAIHNIGYCSQNSYPKKIMKIINKYTLTQYDK